LAQQLYENVEGNLSEKQVLYAKTIHSCGDDLIHLINDILDLSKIESGFISANIASVRIADIASFAETTFKPISETKNLLFNIETDHHLPASIETDSQRLNQILKNLLSNAFKFTEKGEVTLRIFNADKKWKSSHSNLENASRVVAFSISDTGIGISRDKQLIVFEAFQQAEGSTSRKYGGTGLGLSISRGLAELLGGTIELESEEGNGSVFTFYLPLDKLPRTASKGPLEPQPLHAAGVENTKSEFLDRLALEKINRGGSGKAVEMYSEADDDRRMVDPKDKVVVVFDEDHYFGKTVLEMARVKGLKGVIATNYLEVFEDINRFAPLAIILDVRPNDPSSWKVMGLLRNDLAYRHIPVHVISSEENRSLAMKRGARTFTVRQAGEMPLDSIFEEINNNTNKETRRILLVANNPEESSQLENLYSENSLQVELVNGGQKSIELLGENEFDCVVLDYDIDGISGNDLVVETGKVKKSLTPVIVYGESRSEHELESVRLNANFFIPKQKNWAEHTLDATVNVLHVDHKKLHADSQRIIEDIHRREDILIGKTVLVVDDDVRNLFTLTSVLERYKINVITAESGREAIQILRQNPVIEMVLMDIMMPEMDGYETTREIRKEHQNNLLPIIAVTAKAMKGDRQKCIEAGASDYIVKPVKIDQLLSLIRLWFQ
ncbi:MAG TPA: response regulator, partial [Cyclobacteriaceae bacterium]|nr:response regulator [Cyclobacteriaceae bacterium]